MPLHAAETFYGRWAADPSNCGNDDVLASPLIVAPRDLRWPDTVCAIRRSYLVGGVWHVAVRCADSYSDVPVNLRLRGEWLAINWDGAVVTLRRCARD